MCIQRLHRSRRPQASDSTKNSTNNNKSIYLLVCGEELSAVLGNRGEDPRFTYVIRTDPNRNSDEHWFFVHDTWWSLQLCLSIAPSIAHDAPIATYSEPEAIYSMYICRIYFNMLVLVPVPSGTCRLTLPKSVVSEECPETQTRLLLDSRFNVEHSTPLMENETMSSTLAPRLYPETCTFTRPPITVVTPHPVGNVES